MITLRSETSRLVDHFVRAEKLVAAREPVQLDDAQRLVRQLLLDEVAFYRSQRRFPKNHDSEAMRPTFIDAQGTPCAVAHLLQVAGKGELAERIARERNNQLVPDLARDPEFAAWLSAAGLTVEEARIIQPSYGCTSPAECVCGEGWVRTGATPVKAVLLARPETADTARVEKVFGDTTWRVGDLVNVEFASGTHVVIGIAPDAGANAGADGGVPLSVRSNFFEEESGLWKCFDQGLRSESKPITIEVYAEAVLAANCKAKLAELEPSYAANPCGPAGCSAASDSGSPASVAILLAVVGAIVARRLR